MDRNLIPQTRRITLGGATSAGFGDTITFTEVDMQSGGPWESVVCSVLLGTITSTGTATLRVRESDTSGTYGSGTVDLVLNLDGTVATAAATTGDSNKVLSLEVMRPRRRYVRFELVRATANVAVVGAFGECYNPVNTLQSQATADGYANVALGNRISLV